MVDRGQLYASVRKRITDLVMRHAERAEEVVPACPEWRVKDVIAHLAGSSVDWSAGRLEGFGTAAWTAAQVEARRGVPLRQLLDEWEGAAPAFERVLSDPAAVGAPQVVAVMGVTDIATHEQDLRGALAEPGARDSDALLEGLRSFVAGVRVRHAPTSLPPLRLVAEDMRDWMVGKGEPAATVTASTFELFRALGGRRSQDQVRALAWEGDPEPYLPIFIPELYEWPTRPLTE